MLKESAPVYVNSTDGASYLQKGSEWFWGTLAPQIGESAALPVPAIGFVKGAGMGLNYLNKASKIGLATSPKAKQLLNTLGTAITSRQIENTAEADQVQKAEYKRLIDAGVDETEAKHLASEAAAYTYRADWGMLMQDIMEYKMLLRGFNTSKAINSAQVAKTAGTSTRTARLTRAGEVGGQVIGESVEEAGQFINAEEGKYRADVMAGLIDPKGWTERFGEYLLTVLA